MTDDPLPLESGLFGRLRRDAGPVWSSYVAHDFVRSLGSGTLPQAAFRHLLIQDYLFLIRFARAHAPAGRRPASPISVLPLRQYRPWSMWKCRCTFCIVPAGG